VRPAIKIFYLAGVLSVGTGFMWGFYGHERINHLAVFTLPSEMIGFYKKNLRYVTEASVNPDRRRFAVPEEAPRHYIDLDHYGDSALYHMPRYWKEAVEKFTEDTLQSYGILPWHIQRMYLQLRDAFFLRDPARILKISAELGHYLADAHVPLHTTENYNGQLTGQTGIHAFWESRLPELYSQEYNFFVGTASYIENTQLEAWRAIESSHRAVDSVLRYEKQLALKFGEKKYSFETKGKQTVRVYSKEYSKAYHSLLAGMVEKQMRASIRCVGRFWYTAWVDAGEPDLKKFIDYVPTEEELKKNREELEAWKEKKYRARGHESEL
jgi:hypothetical protein